MFELGDGADEMRSAVRVKTVVRGGAGDDLLLSEGWTVLDGGPGGDRMDAPGITAATVDYGSRTAGVSVTVGRDAGDGGPGEGDDVGPGIDEVVGGTGADAIDLTAGGSIVHAGPGPDLVTGGERADVLSGDGGDDRIDARGGDDRLIADPGADVVRGGDGRDEIEYRYRTAPLDISLDDRPGDGEAGENDDVGSDVEGVLGGIGPDVIRGSAGPDRLNGGPGVDRLDAGAGDDHLTGEGQGGPPEEIVAGPGRDYVEASGVSLRIDVADGERDVVKCFSYGPEIRRDAGIDGLDGCFAPPPPPPPPAPKGSLLAAGSLHPSKLGWTAVRVSCRATSGTCRGTVSLRRRGAVLAWTSFAADSGERTRVRLRLRRSARALLARRGRLRVTVVATYRDAAGSAASRRTARVTPARRGR